MPYFIRKIQLDFKCLLVMLLLPGGGGSLIETILSGALAGILAIYPILLSLINFVFIFAGCTDPVLIRKGRHFEWIALILGSFYSLLILPFTNITFSDWIVTLHNAQKHTPIWTEGALTVLILSAVGILGYLLLSCTRLSKVPPLITVFEIAAMYLCLLPLNCILIGIKVIRQKVIEWERIQRSEAESEGVTGRFKNKYLEWLNRRLEHSAVWPAAAFLFMWPMLAVIICILILFGQRPDSAIRAWTETSDWNLSQKIASQNIFYDEHYLCTVAAGGHRKVVKPIRMGVRHGHPVIVNRQLCVANAFEQILEERVPKLHRNVRYFYDRYGFPVAKLIRSPYIADIVYFLMKPLEWGFLLIIYMTDVKPEDRIAVQYLPEQTECTGVTEDSAVKRRKITVYLAKCRKSGYNK